MTEIPDDVMKAAVVAFNTAIDMDGYEGSYEVIARAILAERERCAKVAESDAKGFNFQEALANGDDMEVGAKSVMIYIADRIRNS